MGQGGYLLSPLSLTRSSRQHMQALSHQQIAQVIIVCEYGVMVV